MDHIVISPHADDAVLSCYTLLTSPESFREFCGGGDTATDNVYVVNMFAGLPPRNMTTAWDRECGVRSSWAQVHRRIGEDAEILAGLGLSPYYLDELDGQYRPDGPEPDLARIAQGILDQVEVDENSVVWMPLAHYDEGKPTHADHVLARAAAEVLVGDTGARGHYYADLPYLHSSAVVVNPNAAGSEWSVLPMRADRSKLRVCRQYETQWRFLNTRWRFIRNERYLKR